MAPLPQSAEAHYRAMQRLSVAAMGLAGTVWDSLPLGLSDAAWADAWGQLFVVTSSAQLGAAKAGAQYVPTVLEELGIRSSVAGEVAPEAFVAVASDGRALAALLESPMAQSRALIAQGMDAKAAMGHGADVLGRIVQTQVADAGRAAESVAVAVRPAVKVYVRMLNLPSCSRCVTLAGRTYAWDAAFLRHPRCDCRHIPASENIAGDLTTDPLQALQSGQVTGVSKADKRAILDDGADPNKVLNARRGMYTEQGMKLTREGTKRRGAQGIRPRPETLYKLAGSRSEAVDLLRKYGYIV